MSSITFSSFIFSVLGFAIVIICKPFNDGFESVGVKLLNNYGVGGKLLNIGGGCGGGGEIKLLNVGGGGSGGGG